MRTLFAYQSTLGLGAVGRTMALPIAHGLLTHALALGLRIRALGVAERILTYGITLGASSYFTMFDRASNLALGFVALNLTLGASEFLTSGGALGRLAHGLAYLITNGFVALPLTLGMAVITITAVSTRIGASASSKGALLLWRERGVGEYSCE